MPDNNLEEVRDLIKYLEHENMVLNVEYNKTGKLDAKALLKSLHNRIHAYEKYVSLLVGE